MPNSDKAPYLSVVVTGRNDNYGGDFLQRLQHFVDRLSYLVEKEQLPTELVLVNYNPIAENTSLETSITWPENRSYLHIRIINVPSEVHKSLVDQTIRKTVPLFEFIAKNIGVRRARGEFILCTNADILFSDKLFHYLAQKALQKGCLYRANRLDFVAPDVKMEVASPGFEEGLEPHIFKFFLQGGTFNLRRPKALATRLSILHAYNRFRKTYYGLLTNKILATLLFFFPKIKSEEFFLMEYHCNASGDMALLDRDSWQQMTGYPEATWISTHTDSLHVVSAVARGFRLEVIPHPIYHQEHHRRFDFSAHNPDMDRMYELLLSQIQKMLTRGEVMENQPHWGLAHHTFSEVCL
ncbi:hypothetical protein [Lewinella sp. LCG006]|uniref:hypothetical protein n=1 Tax=Lewinella sp. LCG006 TaxID=3231911 RepID=UPI00345F9B8D